MNLISFTNFNISDNQTHLFPIVQKDEKTEDFSAILNNIFVALQTANLPVTNFSSGFEKDVFQVKTVSDGGQNFVVSDSQISSENSFSQSPVLLPNTEKAASINLNQNILPTAANAKETVSVPTFKTETPIQSAPTEKLVSIPTNFQPAPKLPTMQNFWAEKPVSEKLAETSQTPPQNNQTLRVEPSVISKDFEILSDPKQTSVLPPQNSSFVAPPKSEQKINLLQVFKNVRDSIRENDLPKEISLKTVLPENNLAKKEINAIENQPIELPALKTKTASEVVKPQANETMTEAQALPFTPQPTQKIQEYSELKLPTVEDLKFEAKLPLKLDLSSKVNSVFETSVKAEIQQPQNILSPSEAFEVLVVEPKLPELGTKTQVVLETKSPVKLDLTLKTEIVSAREKLPIESESKAKTEVVSQPQSNLKAPNKPSFEEVFASTSNYQPIPIQSIENPAPSFSDAPILNEVKSEFKPSQPISLNLDSQIVESAYLKPQAENTFINEIVQPKVENSAPNEPTQPKVENNFIEEMPEPNLALETAKPNLVETAQTILTGDDFIGFNLPFDNVSKPILADNKSINVNPTLASDKTIRPDLVEKTVNVSVDGLLKTNSVESKSAGIYLPAVQSSVLPQILTEEVNPTEIKADNPQLKNYPGDAEKVEKTPIRVNVSPENQKLNQLQNVISNEPIPTENKIKMADLGTSQNFNFSEKPEKEVKPNEFENNLPIAFDKVIENAAKEAKVVETPLKTQLEPAKIVEQLNPHLLELAALVGKKHEKEILKMRLHPAELGTVEITLERDNSGVLNAQIKTETADAQQALSKGLELLRDNLQNAGWEVGKLEISNGSSSSTDNQNRENNSRKSELQENFVFSRSSEQTDEVEQNSPQRLLNLLA